MTLTTVPLARRLPDPGQPFVVYAVWAEGPEVKISAANLPGGPLGEFAVGGELARVIGQVHPEELPIALTLRLAQVGGRGAWVFDFLGESDQFNRIWRIPPDVQPTGPRPLSLEELNQGAKDQLRESLGLPPDVPLPEPPGQLPADEANEAPYRFDPVSHMDLTRAEPAPALPPPAPPGPEPTAGAETFAPPPIPPPQDRQHGAYGDESVPFAH